MNGSYDDIIDLPHPVSKKRPQMSVIDRAAQFSPFAALTGYDAAVKETARLTDKRLELDEYEIAMLNDKLRIISEQLAERPEISITFFLPDAKKAGGAYITATGAVKKLLTHEHAVVMENDKIIPIEEIIDIKGDIFRD